MYWKLKSMIINAVSLLPNSASYDTYYWIQRHIGGLRRINPVSTLSSGVETWKRIKEQGSDPIEKVFLEIGTGRAPLVPLSYWLMGARKTITIDMNPYLKGELIRESLRYILDNKEEIYGLFGYLLDKKRFDDLLEFSRNTNISTRSFLDLCCIDYIAPGNAADTGLSPQSIDFHTSYAVFEHIPLKELRSIFEEGNRIINKRGLFIHKIDYKDHFSYTDKKISPINFLQYSNAEWRRYAGNKYMYTNRLRHDDYINLIQSVGHRILDVQSDKDRWSQELLESEFIKLNERFDTKSKDILSISASWIVSKKSD